ncbi:hypothetical protein NDU88_006967 [Pleurodeles waltl]|uniref:Uncharacterized protein n=1 Tax=Pleurodeles waltl TaxID=8319 RepID=A0AAV7MFG3_PLEWA|nr:hypothetical protein NDU88_006967 [Pleurodeles waltl]
MKDRSRPRRGLDPENWVAQYWIRGAAATPDFQGDIQLAWGSAKSNSGFAIDGWPYVSTNYTRDRARSDRLAPRKIRGKAFEARAAPRRRRYLADGNTVGWVPGAVSAAL